MKNLKKYNGWAAKARQVRGSAFYAALNRGEIDPPKVCAACGQENGPVWNTYHAEDYGSLWDDYLKEAKPLCPRCHGMIHLRFQFPNRWIRYKQRILLPNYGGLWQFKNLTEVFAFAKTIKDIEYVEDKPTGIEWLDKIPPHPYEGVEKIATVIDDGQEVPDPKIYGDDWVTMSGVVMRASGELAQLEWERVTDQGDLFK